MLLQQRKDLVGVPARIAEFDDVAGPGRQRLQKSRQSFEVQRPARRQLEEHGTERGVQVTGALQKAVDRLVRILELFHVRQEPAGLDGVDKSRRCLTCPFTECRCFGESVEGVVDLHGVEPRGIVVKPAIQRQLVRIEVSAPVLLLPARTSHAGNRVVPGTPGHAGRPAPRAVHHSPTTTADRRPAAVTGQRRHAPQTC